MKRLLGGLVALGLLVGGAGEAKAGYLGATMDWQYFAFGGPHTGPNVFVDNGGVAGIFADKAGVPYFKIIADDNSITFDYSVVTHRGTWGGSLLSLSPTIHNGIAIDLISGPDFGSVTVDPATNMIGFDKSDISFTANQIQVDWQKLSFGPDTIVELDIAPIPEPATLLLFALGTLGVIGWAWRRRWQSGHKVLRSVCD
jgi:hypothetical protein